MSWSIPATRPIRRDDELMVREARAADFDRILEIEQAAHPTPWARDVFARELDLDISHVWGVAKDSPEEIVAFVVFWVVHDEVHVLNVAVDPAFRRTGIATSILQHLAEKSREENASFITLEVRHQNRAAIALYEALGYEIIGRREAYYADTGEDALIMSLLI
ncbi:MAG: ribosomal protein S18-alanine N-acetyltransferase [Persicimonas sp.]